MRKLGERCCAVSEVCTGEIILFADVLRQLGGSWAKVGRKVLHRSWDMHYYSLHFQSLSFLLIPHK